jgi:hypothetical protein
MEKGKPNFAQEKNILKQKSTWVKMEGSFLYIVQYLISFFVGIIDYFPKQC